MKESKLTYKPFNFLKLDTRLNTQNLQKKKKQQLEKQTLNLARDMQPNLQLIQQCQNIMKNYKDHYNGNRKFSIFTNQYHNYIKNHQTKKNNQNQEQLNQSKLKQRSNQKSDLKRSSSTHDVSRILYPKKSLMLLSGQNIMKPIKSNQYINFEGIINLSQKSKQQHYNRKVEQICQKFKLSTTKLKDKSINTAQQLKSINFNPNSNKFITNRNKSQQANSGGTVFSNKKLSNASRERRKYLKELFKKNIQLIISKLKIMKISFAEIIQKKVLDCQLPYRFGQAIFHAVKQGNQPQVFRMLIQNRFSIFSRDSTLKTPLVWACIRGHHNIAQLLLSNGVQPHAKDRNSKTALFYAIKYNQVECAKIMFLYSYYLQQSVNDWKMSDEMRKIVRVACSSFVFLLKLRNIEKKKQYFQQQYKYYYKE